MKRFITDIYKVLYRFTGIKIFSIALTVAYISALNLVTIYGLINLLNGLVRGVTVLLMLFTFPYFVYTALFMLMFNLCLLMPFKTLARGKRKRPIITPILVYSFVAILLFIYGRFLDDIKF